MITLQGSHKLPFHNVFRLLVAAMGAVFGTVAFAGAPLLTRVLLGPGYEAAIPVLREMDAQKLAAGLQPGAPLIANLDGFPWRAQLPALAPRIISQIDGRKTVAEIYTAMGAQGGLPRWEDFYAQFEDLYIKLNGVNHVLLRFRP